MRTILKLYSCSTSEKNEKLQKVIEYVSAKSQKKIEKRQLQEATQKANRKRGAHIPIEDSERTE